MESKRQIREINASSMADIAFLLLIFFLVATTMNVDTGIARLLPPIPPDEIKNKDLEVKERDLLKVYVTQYDEIAVSNMVFNNRIDVTQLKDIVKAFMLNPTGNEQLPDKEVKELEMPDGSKWSVPVSKGVVSLNNDRGTSYDMYIKVQNELVRAFGEMRDDAARAKFNKDFMQLETAERDVISKAVPQAISEAEPHNVGGN